MTGGHWLSGGARAPHWSANISPGIRSMESGSSAPSIFTCTACDAVGKQDTVSEETRASSWRDDNDRVCVDLHASLGHTWCMHPAGAQAPAREVSPDHLERCELHRSLRCLLMDSTPCSSRRR